MNLQTATYGPITYGKHRKEWGSLRGISERDGACAINFFSNQPALNYGFYQRIRKTVAAVL